MYYLCTEFQKRVQKYNKKFILTNLINKIMKKVFAIVLYYDKKGNRECREVNVLFEDESIAKFVATTICEEKKLFYKLKEYVY